MIRVADIRPCPNCASKVVPVSNCNNCGSLAVRPDVEEVDRRIECTECHAENPTLFVCEKCNNRFLFEEVAGPEREKFACILCGTFVDADAKSCPACGAIFEEEPSPKVAPRAERPRRRTRGEFADPDVDEIARIPGVGRVKAEALCRAGFNALWKIKRATDEEIGRVKGIGPRGAKTIRDSLRFILLLPRRKSKEEVLSEEHACPLCGCVTSLFAKSCSDCGVMFDEEEIEDEVRRELEKELEKGLLAFYDVHIEESPQDTDLWYARALLLLDMGELPEAMRSIEYAARMDPASRKATIVRSRVLSAMKETKQAAAGFRGTVAALVEEGQVRVRKAAEEEAKVTSKALEALTALAGRECPTCGESVLPDARVCPACGARLEPAPALSPGSGLEVLGEEPAPPPPEPEPVPEVPEAPEVAALKELERVVAESRPPAEEEPEAVEEVEEEVAEEEVPEEAEPEEPAVEVVEVPESGPVRPPPPARRPIEAPRPRARELEAPQARFRRGLINGHGLINGSGRVNGLVNGLGFMDTSALTELRLPQRSLLLRYGIVASSLLLAFVVAAALFPFSPGPALAITIDGNPGEWANLPKYVDPSPASDPNVSIQRYGVLQEGNLLSFLVQVSGQALGDASGYDAFYAFFDTDASPATGYQVRGMGADYVAEVYGGSGRVAYAALFAFPANSELNWSRRMSVAGLPAAASGSSLEFRVHTDDLTGFSAGGSTILLATDDFDGSSSQASVAITAAFGAIRIHEIPLLSVVPTGTTPALRLDVSAVGAIGPSDSWVVGPFTFTATTGVTATPSPSQVTLTGGAPAASVIVSVSAVGVPAAAPIAVRLASAPAAHPVTVVGDDLEAYYISVPLGIRIDGLFADWAALGNVDSDAAPISRSSLDVTSYGGAANASGTFFMVQVAGSLYAGSLAPQRLVPGTGGGGNGSSAPPLRVTGEDLARVYVDSNRTDTAGIFVGGIYADYMVEVRGAGGRITGQTAYRWQAGWVPAPTLSLQVAKNATALEGFLGLNPALLNGTEMVFETTDWTGGGDATAVLVTRSAAGRGTRASGIPIVMDISGNGKYWFHDTVHATETACTYNKVANSTQGTGPAQTLTLSTNEAACWYVDSTSGSTIPAGDWETLLDVSSGGAGAAYDVRLEIWNKDTDSVDTPIGSCLGQDTFGDDIRCPVTGVGQQTLSSNQVVRVNITNSGSGPTVSIAYDDNDSTGDSRTTLPLPEFHEVVFPTAVCLVLVLLLRWAGRRRSTRLSR